MHKLQIPYEKLLETIQEGIWVIDADSNTTYANPKMAEIVGYEVEEMIGKNLFEFMDEEELQNAERNVERRKSGIAETHESRLKHKDGHDVYVELKTIPLTDDEGNYNGAIAALTDITERKRLEQSLARSEERFQKMLSLVPDMVSIHDADMNIVYSNWNGFGAVPEEKRILNTKCYKTYRGLDQICPDCKAVKVLQTGEAFREEVELSDGMWVDLRVIPIFGEDQSVEYIVEWVGDITERKKAEKELNAQHELLEGIMNNVADVLSIQYPDHTIERYNRAGYELLGMTPEEVRGKKCHQLIGREHECEECATAKALQSGKLEQVERYFPELGLHLHCRANPVFEDGKIVFVIQHLMDITKRKQDEEALRESEKRLKEAQRIAKIGDFTWNVYSGEATWSDSLYELLGYNKADIIDYARVNAEIHHPEDLEHVTQWLNGCIESGSNVLAPNEYRLIRKDNKVIHVNTTGMIERKEGHVMVFATLQDITERKKTEEALKRQAAERAAVDTFTYSVSNDLQAPLRRIEGFSDALQEECADQLTDQAKDYLDRIVAQVGSMKKLTDALLQLSRVVSREIDRETIDLSALVRSCLEKLKFKEPKRQLEVVIAPGVCAEGDPELLNLMLGCLLDNAWKFTSGIEKARIEFGSNIKDGRTVYYIKDNGAGFDMNRAEKLFVPFQRLHSDDSYPGIGIGLNLVYRIISRHGGEIWAEGEEGKGACFYFTLS